MYPPARSVQTMPPSLFSKQPVLQPYLGLRASLSLSWLSHHFLALLLVVVSLIFLLSTIALVVAEAKAALTAGCNGVEGAANAIVSLPHFMADGVNEMNAAAVRYAVEGLAEVIDVTLLSIEAIAIFIIDMYRSLFLCLLDLAVHGSLDLLISGIEEAQSFVTGAFQSARSDIQSAVSGIDTALADAVKTINRIPGVDINTPSFDIPSLTSLQNVTIPSTILTSLENLNASIPTLDELRATLNSIISTPIDDLRAKANTSLANATISIAALPVPARSTVELCLQLDTSFIDDVGHVLKRFLQIAIVLVVLAMLLLVVVCAWWERRSYRLKLESVDRARDTWLLSDLSNPARTFATHNLLAFVSATEHPTVARIFSWFGNKFRLSPTGRVNALWFGSYVFHPAASMILLFGLVGLLVIQIQLAVLEGPVKDLATQRASEGIGSFSDSALLAINSKMNASSLEFANSSNAVILGIQNGVNDDLFGWVNTTTVAMNNTLNTFYDGLTGAVTDFFEGTPFVNVSLNLVYCLIGSKVVGLEKALTFMHDHAHISLPTVSDTVLLLSPNRTAELTSDLTSPTSPVSSSSVVEKMVERYASALRQQRLGFIVCIVLWLFVFLLGLGGLLWALRGQEWWDRRRERTAGLASVDYKGPSQDEGPSEKVKIPFAATPSQPNPPDQAIDIPPPAPQYTFPSTTSSRSSSRFVITLPHFPRPSIFSPSAPPPPTSKVVATPFSSSAPRSLPRLPEWSLPPNLSNMRASPAPVDSEMLELRTGATVQRSFPSTSKLRGALVAASSVMRRKHEPSSLARNGSLTSLGPRRDWDDGEDVGDEALDSPLSSPGGRNELHLSIGPVKEEGRDLGPAGSEDMTTPATGAAPPPLACAARPQPSSYTPTSRPAINPFLTPFDDPAVVVAATARRAPNPFLTPFDGVGES